MNNKINNFGKIIKETVEINYSKRIAELNWVLMQEFENGDDKSVKKVKNWLNSHKEVPIDKIPESTMCNLNAFDMRVYGEIKKR